MCYARLLLRIGARLPTTRMVSPIAVSAQPRVNWSSTFFEFVAVCLYVI